MRYGLYLPNFGAFGDPLLLAELARDAEEAGWDGFFVWDHVNRDWPTPVADPWIALAAISERTSRLRIGALVTPLARRRPWKVARETVTLDHLSSGRLVFGAGLGSAGGGEPEWRAFGEETDLGVRAAMLDEGLAVLAGLWSGEPFSFEGRHYRVRETRFLPTPVQSPRIPVWIGGYWPNRAPFRRAARWDGAFPLFDRKRGDPVSQLRELVRFIREIRDDPAPYDVVHLAVPTLDDHVERRAEIVAPYREAGATWWLERITPDSFGAEWQGAWPIEAMREHIRRGPSGPQARREGA
jgi:alkanesulfonate monooxygenase SsuD/methylene tetrahydromethanopterin reductase-like flavin-dependent oxidoreductase (luciferase family)